MAGIDALKQQGQSIWLDNIDRQLLVTPGGLRGKQLPHPR